jgi:hypothetical protein
MNNEQLEQWIKDTCERLGPLVRKEQEIKREIHDVMLQLTREYALASPPQIEVAAAMLPEERQIPTLKWLVRKHADEIYRMGIKSWPDLTKFIEVIEVCEKRGWITPDDCHVICDRVSELVKAQQEKDDGAYDNAERALRNIAAGVGKGLLLN